MKNVYLFQPQYAVEMRNETNYWLPYSVGCLWSYAQQFDDITENIQLSKLFFRREEPIQVIRQMETPSVCGFSCYVWNKLYCIHMAQKIKEQWPNCIIVFGGPESNPDMLQHTFIDSIILGEGEEAFLELLRSVLNNIKPDSVYSKKRLANLDMPSPYTLGLFDNIIKEHPNAVWAMTLETNRGCPYQCTFCDWGSITYSKVKRFDIEKIQEDINWAASNQISYIFCADANFGMFKERDLEIAQMIRTAADQGIVDAVAIQYAKNSTEIVFKIAQILKDISRGVTVSVQSLHEPTLVAIKRKNLDVNNIKNLISLSKKYDVLTYTEVILGLPLETLESWKISLCNILELGQHELIDMFFCQLLKNSELSSDSSRDQYKIKSVIANDYLSITNNNDWSDITEEIELVNGTSTMSTLELVDAYMYGWVIIQFHIGGYTREYSKYLRNTHHISYKEFYDRFYLLLLDNKEFAEHYAVIKDIVNNYITNGNILINDPNLEKSGGGGGLHSLSIGFIYKNRSTIFDIGFNCALMFDLQLPSELKMLQENMIYNQTNSYPLKITLPFDIDDYTDTVSTYTISNKYFDNNKHIETEIDYNSRRKGIIKNIIKLIDII